MLTGTGRTQRTRLFAGAELIRRRVDGRQLDIPDSSSPLQQIFLFVCLFLTADVAECFVEKDEVGVDLIQSRTRTLWAPGHESLSMSPIS